jgi:hypothetical protein
MSEQKKETPRRPRRLRTNPKLVGFVHNVQFGDDGVSIDPVTAKEEERLVETFEGVEFSVVEDPKPTAPADQK